MISLFFESMQNILSLTLSLFLFKRPAAETGDIENMNNPASKTRLTEMYQKLKLLQWPKIKDHLKANGMTPEFTKSLIQVTCTL